MRKILSLGLATIILLSSSLAYGNSYGLLPSYGQIIDNNKYNDISKSFAKEAIVKLTVLDILEGEGKNFKPGSGISRRDSLKAILATLGIKENNPLIIALDLAIISPEEVVRTSNLELTTREEAALWLARASAIEPQNPAAIKKFKDHNSFNKDFLPYIEGLVQNGYLSGYGDGNFRPKQRITREEFASMINRLLDPLLRRANYTIKEGHLHTIEEKTDLSTNPSSYETRYYVENFDGTSSLIKSIDPANESMEDTYIRYYIDPYNRVLFIEKL